MPREWHPGFHDPTVVGWTITIAYLAAAIFALVLGKRYRPEKTAVVWFALAAGLFLLCLNKQLDLQAWLAQTGRDLTREHGLYQFKHLIRYAFMVVLVLAALVPVVLFRFHLWTLVTRAPLGAAGLALIGVFILMRGVEYHPSFLTEDGEESLEAAGLALVLWSFGRRVFASGRGGP